MGMREEMKAKEKAINDIVTALVSLIQPGVDLQPRDDAKVSERTAPLRPNELAARWGLHPNTLGVWRHVGKGPKFVKVGSKVLYRMEEVKAYEEKHLQRSTVG